MILEVCSLGPFQRRVTNDLHHQTEVPLFDYLSLCFSLHPFLYPITSFCAMRHVFNMISLFGSELGQLSTRCFDVVSQCMMKIKAKTLWHMKHFKTFGL